MKSKVLAILMLVSLAISTLAFAVHTSPVSAANENVVLSVNPPTVNKIPGDSSFDAYVDVAAVTDLFGFDINVTWTDNSLITIDPITSNVTTATILDGVWGAGNWFCVEYQSGAGYFRYVALSTHSGFNGTGHLMDLHFQIMRSSNFQLQTTIQINSFKLSDSKANSIPATTTSELFTIAATTPDLEFNLINPNTNKPYEYGKYFEIQVYATDITSNLTGYDLKVDYTSELLAFYQLQVSGPLGTPTVDTNTPGVVEVSISEGASTTGPSILLFTLTFQVKFDNIQATHIWTNQPSHQTLSATVSLDTNAGGLTFTEGPIAIGGIITPSSIPLTIHLIQGDVDCDGTVTGWSDLRIVAYYYDQSSAQALKYDLKTDGTIDIYDLVLVANNIGYNIPDNPPP